MTTEQKNHISRLRMAGDSYKKISETLSIPLSTVKSYCQRNALPSYVKEAKPIKQTVSIHSLQSKEDTSACKQCNRHIDQLPNKKPKQFCCDTCRMKWWHSHKEQMKHKVRDTRICAGCGLTFEVYGVDERKYCCRACYNKYRYKDIRVLS